MHQWFYHWIWLDLWTPVWPNLVASLVVYIFVFFKMRSLQKLHEEQARFHEQMKAMHIQHHREQMKAIKTESGTG